MPIDVICPKCHSRLRAPEEVAGKSVRCKKCQEKFKVPSAGPSVESVGDTQQLSVLEVPKAAIPTVAAAIPLKPKVAVMEPEPLDDSAFDAPTPNFAVADETVAEEADRPRKKKKRPRDDDEELDDRPRKKKVKEKPVIGGEPTFNMPGSAEDLPAVFAPPPIHATQFSFDEPAPPTGKKKRPVVEVDEDDNRPRKQKKPALNEDEADDVPPSAAKKKKSRLPMILGGIAAFLLLGCGGVAAAVYFFVVRTADAISQATLTVGTGPKVDAESKSPANLRPSQPTPTPTLTKVGDRSKEIPVVGFAIPDANATGGIKLADGNAAPLPISPDTVSQVHRFGHPLHGPMVLIVSRTQLGFNGAGAEDTFTRFDIVRKTALEFNAGADNISGPRLFDISDSGDRVAVEAPKGRLTVYDFRTKTKVFDGFDIYAGIPERGGLAAIGFGDSEGNRVAVVDKTGAIDIFDIAERQRAVKGVPDPNKSEVVVAPRLFRRELGLMSGKGWQRTFSFATGKPEGQPILHPAKTGPAILIAGQTLGGNTLHTAILHRPEGAIQQEILFTDKHQSDQPATANPVWRLTIPATLGLPKSLRWTQNDEVLVLGFETPTSVLMIDFANKSPVVLLKAGQEKTILSATGMASVQPDPAKPGKALLVEAQIPPDTLPAMSKTSSARKTPEVVYFKPNGLTK